jgi:hypothetical protein
VPADPRPKTTTSKAPRAKPCGHLRLVTEKSPSSVRRVCPDCDYDEILPRCPRVERGRHCGAYVCPGDVACHSHLPGRPIGARASRINRAWARLDRIPVGPPGMTRAEIAALWEGRDPDWTLASKTASGDLVRRSSGAGRAAHYWRPEPPMKLSNIGGTQPPMNTRVARQTSDESDPPRRGFIGGVGGRARPGASAPTSGAQQARVTGDCQGCGAKDSPQFGGGNFRCNACNQRALLARVEIGRLHTAGLPVPENLKRAERGLGPIEPTEF